MRPTMALPRLPLLLALLTALAAGCTEAEDHGGSGDGDGHGDDGHGHGHELGADAFQLTFAGVPSTLAPNATFQGTLTVRSSSGEHGTSDHVGAHFWNATQADPTAAIGSSTACTHRQGNTELPGSFNIECTAPATPGTYHVYGHVRISGGTTLNWWSAPSTFTVR